MPTYRVGINIYAIHQIHRGRVSAHTGGAANTSGTSYGHWGNLRYPRRYPVRLPLRLAVIGVPAAAGNLSINLAGRGGLAGSGGLAGQGGGLVA